MTSLTLRIDGMSCGHCLNAVNRALSTITGVEVVSVTMGRADVRFDPQRVAADQVVAAIARAGYPARVWDGG